MKHTLIALAFAALLSACDGGSTGNSSTAAPPAQPATPPIAIDATGKARMTDFTVTDVATPSQIGPAGVGPKAEAGETFVVVSYTIKNTGEKALPYMERPGVTLTDPSGRSYATDDMATAMTASTMNDPSGVVSDLNPNVSAKTKAAWKVDKASFDRGTWKLVVASDPTLTFALK